MANWVYIKILYKGILYLHINESLYKVRLTLVLCYIVVVIYKLYMVIDAIEMRTVILETMSMKKTIPEAI